MPLPLDWLKEYIALPRDFYLTEEHDRGKLTSALNNPLLQKDDKDVIKGILSNLSSDGQLVVKYSRGHYGRYYPTGPCSTLLRKCVRYDSLPEDYQDLDMVNASASCALLLCKAHGLDPTKYGQLELFVYDRQRVYDSLAVTDEMLANYIKTTGDIDADKRDLAKQIMLIKLNGGGAAAWDKIGIVDPLKGPGKSKTDAYKLMRQWKSLGDHFADLDCYKTIKHYAAKDGKDYTFFSVLISTLETYLITLLICKMNGISPNSVAIYEYDGIWFRRSCFTTTMRDIIIKDQLVIYKLKDRGLTLSDMDPDDYVLPTPKAVNGTLAVPVTTCFDCTSFSTINDLVVHKGATVSSDEEITAKIAYFNQHVAYIEEGSNVAVRATPDKWIIYPTDVKRKTYFAPCSYMTHLGPSQFLARWLSDTRRQTFHTIGWFPATINDPYPPCPKNTLNVFCRFLHDVGPVVADGDRRTTTFKVDMSKVRPWLKHFRDVWAAGDPVVYRYIVKWFAHIVQKCDKTGVCIVLKSSREGAGKNIVADFFRDHVIGNDNVWQTSDMEQFLQKHNSHAAYILLNILDEIEGRGAAFKHHNRMKDIITRIYAPIEPKGVDAYQSRDRSSTIITSNTNWGAKISISDRRNLCLEASNIYADDDGYFQTLLKSSNATVGQHFFHYLLQTDLTGFNIRKVPMTEWKRTLMDRSEDAYLKTIRKLHHNNISTIGMTELRSLFNSFDEDKDKRNAITNNTAFQKAWESYFKDWSPIYKLRLTIGGKQTKKAGYQGITEDLLLASVRSVRKDPEWSFPVEDSEASLEESPEAEEAVDKPTSVGPIDEDPNDWFYVGDLGLKM
jgi:hypothetical protein